MGPQAMRSAVNKATTKTANMASRIAKTFTPHAITAFITALFTTMASASCPADTLGTSRTLTLPRAAAAYGTAQHPPLPLQPGEVVLTFDDGPRAESTPLVLQALAQHCVLATFFMNGEPLLQQPALAKQVAAAGHTVGMHGFQHRHFGEWPEAAQLADLSAMQAAWRQVFGGQPAAYRFPFLEETPALRAALKAQAITVMSVDAGADDWLPDQTPAMLTERLLAQLRSKGGGIILLHDAQDQTARALPTMLAALKAQGLRVVHLRWADAP